MDRSRISALRIGSLNPISNLSTRMETLNLYIFIACVERHQNFINAKMCRYIVPNRSILTAHKKIRIGALFVGINRYYATATEIEKR